MWLAIAVMQCLQSWVLRVTHAIKADEVAKNTEVTGVV
jgi:hypothetical protein